MGLNYSNPGSPGSYTPSSASYTSLNSTPISKVIFPITKLSANPLYSYASLPAMSKVYENRSFSSESALRYTSDVTSLNRTFVEVNPSKGTATVMRSLEDIAADKNTNTTRSLDAAKQTIGQSNLPYHLKEKAYKSLNDSEYIGRLYLELINSPEGQELIGNLARKGHYSTGIQNIIAMNDKSLKSVDGDEEHGIMASTAPKIPKDATFISYNGATVSEYKKMLKGVAPYLSERLLDADILKHEITHSFLHDQNSDPLQAEVDVEKTLAFHYSRLASKSKNPRGTKQYEALANMHINLYMGHRNKQANLSGEPFDAGAEYAKLYEEYVAESSQDNKYEAVAAEALQGYAGHAEHDLEAIVEETTSDQANNS